MTTDKLPVSMRSGNEHVYESALESPIQSSDSMGDCRTDLLPNHKWLRAYGTFQGLHFNLGLIKANGMYPNHDETCTFDPYETLLLLPSFKGT